MRPARQDVSRGNAEAILAPIVEKTTERVEPRCRHFGTCGGCQLQHLPQAAQLQAKGEMLLQVLDRAGVHDLPPLQVHAAEPWQYRNRARMRVKDGEIGYSRQASNDFLPIAECPIVSPLVWRAAQALQSTAREGKATWPLATGSFELFADGEDASLQLSMFLDATVSTVEREAPQQFRLFCEQVRNQVPQLMGAGLLVAANPDPAQSRRVQKSARVEIARWGAPGLQYRVGDTDYRVTRNSFFQVNRYLTATMRQVVTEGRYGARAYDLFAGAGLFSVPLTGQFDEVTAVEVGEPAATDLLAHLRSCGPRHRAVRSSVLGFLQSSKNAAPPDLIVLDPPRAGLGRDAARALASLQAPGIVYVSCDVDSFAADCRTLLESGYHIAALHFLDLFPQTSHTETVAVFHR